MQLEHESESEHESEKKPALYTLTVSEFYQIKGRTISDAQGVLILKGSEHEDDLLTPFNSYRELFYHILETYKDNLDQKLYKCSWIMSNILTSYEKRFNLHKKYDEDPGSYFGVDINDYLKDSLSENLNSNFHSKKINSIVKLTNEVITLNEKINDKIYDDAFNILMRIYLFFSKLDKIEERNNDRASVASMAYGEGEISKQKYLNICNVANHYRMLGFTLSNTIYLDKLLKDKIKERNKFINRQLNDYIQNMPMGDGDNLSNLIMSFM